MGRGGGPRPQAGLATGRVVRHAIPVLCRVVLWRAILLRWEMRAALLKSQIGILSEKPAGSPPSPLAATSAPSPPSPRLPGRPCPTGHSGNNWRLRARSHPCFISPYLFLIAASQPCLLWRRLSSQRHTQTDYRKESVWRFLCEKPVGSDYRFTFRALLPSSISLRS